MYLFNEYTCILIFINVIADFGEVIEQIEEMKIENLRNEDIMNFRCIFYIFCM